MVVFAMAVAHAKVIVSATDLNDSSKFEERCVFTSLIIRIDDFYLGVV